jgi:hypothetical protein
MGIARNLARLVPNGSGLLPNANIEAVAASKLTGQVPDANAPSGSVIQVVTAFKSDVFSATLGAGSFTDVTGFAVTITPISASNKILVLANFSLSTGGQAISARLLRGSTLISNGNTSGSRISASTPAVTHTGDTNRGVPASIHFLDSPSTTSAVTYKMQVGLTEPTGPATCYFNASGVDNDAAYNARPGASITVMEIAA